MKKIVLITIIALNVLAFQMTAKYAAKYGIFGTIATATGTYERNATSYKIVTLVHTKGLVYSLSKHLSLTYESYGSVKNGILIPKVYFYIRKNEKGQYKVMFFFNHEKKIIICKKYHNGHMYSDQKFRYYAPDDVLSLYFNLPRYLQNAPSKKTYTFYAVGGRKKDGRIDVSFPTGEELSDAKDELNANGLYVKANLYNKVFVGDKGILYLAINPQNWVTLAGMVKNVLKIGDLKGKLISLQIKY